jgi:hypothetical protein
MMLAPRSLWDSVVGVVDVNSVRPASVASFLRGEPNGPHGKALSLEELNEVTHQNPASRRDMAGRMRSL